MESPREDFVRVEWLTSGDLSSLSGAGVVRNGQFEIQDSPAKPLYFDLASLTKTILTSTLLMETLVEDFDCDWGQFLDLDLRSEIPDLALIPPEIDLRLRSLWEHRSGLPAHFSLTGDLALRKRFQGPRSAMWTRLVSRICEELRHRENSGITTVYSDLGFWILGLWLERKHSMTLAEQWGRWKTKFHLSPKDLCFENELSHSVCSTESRHPSGEVNDDNSYWMGSVSPHAGLFGTVDGISAWLETVKKWTGSHPELKFWIERQDSSRNRFWLGWDTASLEENSQAGSVFAPSDCIGHLGFTGTSFWWSPRRNLSGILLTNRVYPAHSEESQKWIRDFRRQFFSDLWQSKIESKWLL